MMEQTENQRVYVILANKGHDLRIIVRAVELALCNAVLDNTSKFVILGDAYYGDVRKIVQDVAKKNKIDAPDDIFGYYSPDKPNEEFAKRKIVVVKPSSSADPVTKKINDFMELNAKFLHRRFVHFFNDDLIITSNWNPLMIELMMDTFGYPFYCDPKLNQMNTVFGKLSPVKTFVYQKKIGETQVLPFPVVFYGSDDDGYIVFDTESRAWGTSGYMPLDENIRRKFVPLYLYKLVQAGIVAAYDYLPDPFLTATLTKNPLFKNLTDDEKKVLLADLTSDKPEIDKLNVLRRENDFERWPDVLKNLTETCDALEKELTENTANA